VVNIAGTWAGSLAGTSGPLSYVLDLAQNGTMVDGTAQGSRTEGNVTFALTGNISGKKFAFRQTKIVNRSPVGSEWCLIAGTLQYSTAGNVEYLKGNWATKGNTDPNCAGITGTLNVHKDKS
jgi:hypothetical protein